MHLGILDESEAARADGHTQEDPYELEEKEAVEGVAGRLTQRIVALRATHRKNPPVSVSAVTAVADALLEA